MIVVASRDSVCAGDDTEEHVRHFAFPAGTSLAAVVSGVVAARFLASIAGGRATWSAVSRVPIAVIAQEWDRPHMLADDEARHAGLDRRGGALHLHFRYHAQRDPEHVLAELSGRG